MILPAAGGKNGVWVFFTKIPSPLVFRHLETRGNFAWNYSDWYSFRSTNSNLVGPVFFGTNATKVGLRLFTLGKFLIWPFGSEMDQVDIRAESEANLWKRLLFHPEEK